MLHLVFNPVAGRGRAAASLDTALRLLDEAGATYQLHTSAAPGHATSLTAATPPGSTVVAVGGDGTVHEVVRGIVCQPGGDRRLGVLPVGSGDDFAFAIGLDRHDIAGAVARLLEPRPLKVDLCWVNGEPFVNALGVGFDAEVAHRLAHAPPFLKGLAAYLFAVAVSLGRSRPSAVRVWVDDVEVFHGRSLLVASQNGPRTGGSFLFAPSARNDDGLLDVVVAGDLSVVGTLALLPKVMRGRHLGHPQVRLFRGSTVRLEWEQPRHAHAEGEPLPLAARYDVHLEPGALNVLGPAADHETSGRTR